MIGTVVRICDDLDIWSAGTHRDSSAVVCLVGPIWRLLPPSLRHIFMLTSIRCLLLSILSSVVNVTRRSTAVSLQARIPGASLKQVRRYSVSA